MFFVTGWLMHVCSLRKSTWSTGHFALPDGSTGGLPRPHPAGGPRSRRPELLSTGSYWIRRSAEHGGTYEGLAMKRGTKPRPGARPAEKFRNLKMPQRSLAAWTPQRTQERSAPAKSLRPERGVRTSNDAPAR